MSQEKIIFATERDGFDDAVFTIEGRGIALARHIYLIKLCSSAVTTREGKFQGSAYLKGYGAAIAAAERKQ